jgi:hypothetical protein
MEDNQLLATLFTVALHSSKLRETSKKTGPEQWRNVWNDSNQFLKQLDRSDESIDKRGINPD